jgi:hypothetical protein
MNSQDERWKTCIASSQLIATEKHQFEDIKICKCKRINKQPESLTNIYPRLQSHTGNNLHFTVVLQKIQPLVDFFK